MTCIIKKLKIKKLLIIFPVAVITIYIMVAAVYNHHPTEPSPNVIFIVADALRPDHLGCYGYGRNTSPHIDDLAGEGVKFTQAITAGGWTGEAVTSMLTGTYSSVHQVRKWGALRNKFIKTLPQLLKKKGYNPVLFSDHGPMAFVDLKDGFNELYIIDHDDINAQQLTRKIIDWLKLNKDAPFFLYVHYHGCHVPFLSPSEYKNKYINDRFTVKKEVSISDGTDNDWQGIGKIPYIIAEKNISDLSYYIAQYDGTISYTDVQIGELISNLKNLDLLENSIVIFFADHGEMLGEHGVFFTHETCYENVLKVPLIIRFPKFFPEGEIVSQQVSLIDITPTILKILGIRRPFYTQGRNLLPLFKKEGFNILHRYVYTSRPTTVSLRSEDWKLIESVKFGNYELYNISTDPHEQQNLADKEEVRFKKMKKTLEAYRRGGFWDKGIRNKDLSEEQKEKLRSLGYLQ